MGIGFACVGVCAVCAACAAQSVAPTHTLPSRPAHQLNGHPQLLALPQGRLPTARRRRLLALGLLLRRLLGRRRRRRRGLGALQQRGLQRQVDDAVGAADVQHHRTHAGARLLARALWHLRRRGTRQAPGSDQAWHGTTAACIARRKCLPWAQQAQHGAPARPSRPSPATAPGLTWCRAARPTTSACAARSSSRPYSLAACTSPGTAQWW